MMSYFFKKYDMANNIRTCKKVEELISKYSITLYETSAASFNASHTDLSKSIALITGTNTTLQDPERSVICGKRLVQD